MTIIKSIPKQKKMEIHVKLQLSQNIMLMLTLWYNNSVCKKKHLQ